MAEQEDIILEKPEDGLNQPRLDESLEGFKGQEGQAPEDEEFASLPEELPQENSDSGFKLQEKVRLKMYQLLKKLKVKSLRLGIKIVSLCLLWVYLWGLFVF